MTDLIAPPPHKPEPRGAAFVTPAKSVTRYLPIPGTWAYEDAWYKSGPWVDFMAANDFIPVRDEDGEPFRWTTNLNGLAKLFGRIPFINKLPMIRHDDWDWRAGGDGLAYFMDEDVNYDDRNLIAHSHGGPVVAYACLRRKIRTLITIGTPARNDMAPIWAQARPNIGYWLHVMDEKDDHTGFFGGIGDGRWSKDRSQPLADKNLPLPKIGHSNLVRNPECFDVWKTAGLLDVIRSGRHA